MLGNLKGEFAALSAAFLWALAALFYGRATLEIPPRALNLLKGLLAISMLGLTLLVTRASMAAVSPLTAGLLLVSGVLGIGLGDTAYFECLKTIGARRALLMEVLAPPLTALVALIFLGETLDRSAWIGIAMTVLGVAWVISERGGRDEAVPVSHAWRGIGFGLLAAISQSLGAVLSRLAFTQTTISPLWTALIRLSAGVVVLLLWAIFVRQPKGSWAPLKTSGSLWGIILIATFSGTYLGVWLQQISLKFANAGTAQTLLATSQLFILPMEACKGEKISPRAILGALIALGGVALLFGIAR